MEPKRDAPGEPASSSAAPEPPATVEVTGSTEEKLDAAPAVQARDGGPLFAAGERVAGRYRVTRRIAAGGMGEVYEAEDLDLGVRVALKTILAGGDASVHAVERFKREIQLARKVTHPNVCRIFDLGLHLRERASGQLTPLNFLTMELLAGETLAARLERGPLSEAEARPLVAQLADALDAAHAAGVVHRDLKSSNVMLVPVDGGAPRAVITDFGMARDTADEGARITGNGGLVGTPAYMAPEQIEGGPIGPATDVYALGVLIFEAVTGALPFCGKTPLETATRRLKQAPPSPRALAPELDARWEAAILRALAIDPARRFPSAGALARALDEEPSAGAPRGRRRWLAAAAVLAALGLAGAAAYRARPRKVEAPSAGATAAAVPAPERPPAKPRRAVAVLGFKDLSGRAETQWLSTALAEMLGMELGAGEQLRIISGERVDRARLALGLSDPSALAPDTLARVARTLGADYVVVGSYVTIGDGADRALRLDVRLEDAREGETALALTEQGHERALFDLVSSAGRRLRGRFGAEVVSEADTGALRAALPSTSESARLYAEGLVKLRRFDARAARELLAEAARRDPDNALIHASLAQADSQLGFEARAREESERAFALSRKLSREERLVVEGNYLELHHQWQRALGLYKGLFGFFPDNLEYGVRLGWAQVLGGAGQDARATVAELRKLPHAPDVDVQLDLIEAGAAETLSDYKAELAAAERAATDARAVDATIELGRARRDQAWALLQLGQPDRALAAAEECRRIFAAAKNPWGEASALNMMGNAEEGRGRHAAAEQSWRRSLDIAHEAGDQDGEAAALNNLATLYTNSGELDRALKMFDQAMTISRRTGDDEGLAFTLSDVANLYAKRNNYGEDERAAAQSIELFHKIGNQTEAAVVMGNLAATRLQRGDLAGARALREQALAVFEQAGAKALEAAQRSGLARVLWVAGDLDGARREYGRSLALRQAIGDEGKQMSTRLALAAIDVDRGAVDAAEPVVRAALERAVKEKSVDDEVEARVELARIALARKQLASADAEIARAVELAKKDEDARPRLDAVIVAARIHLAAGDRAQAARELDATIAEAARLGLEPRAIEARELRAEVELSSGDAAAARRQLAAVEKQARAHGLDGIARRAAAVRP